MKKMTWRKRKEAFLKEYEKLCKKHGLFVEVEGQRDYLHVCEADEICTVENTIIELKKSKRG